jgi:hypothetical protein
VNKNNIFLFDPGFSLTVPTVAMQPRYVHLEDGDYNVHRNVGTDLKICYDQTPKPEVTYLLLKQEGRAFDSIRIVALKLSQPLTEMSTRNLPGE